MASRTREGLIYWEKQGPGRMCALHCLNSLLQGPYFTEAELSSIGMELDQKERQLMAEGGMHSEEYRAFVAEGSGNVAADGYFNVTVLIECLRRKRIHCLCQKNVGEHEEHGVDFGYMLNHSDHWLALRRVSGTWYNLDSMKPAPTVISNFHLAAFLSSLKGQGYTVFVVRPEVGDLPAPGHMQTRNNNQFYLTQRDIEERHQQARKAEAEAAKNAEQAAGSSEDGGRSFLVQPGRGAQQQHVWPESNGYRLAGPSSPAAAQPDVAEDEDEDPELREAIRLSMEAYKVELTKPPEEAPADEPGVKTLSIRTPSGKRLCRRFAMKSTMKDVCNWVIYESQTLEGMRPLSVLSSFTLVQPYPRRRFVALGKEVMMFAESPEGADVASMSLEELDFQKQEQLLLQV